MCTAWAAEKLSCKWSLLGSSYNTILRPLEKVSPFGLPPFKGDELALEVVLLSLLAIKGALRISLT